jgi:hypothetical protein
MSRSLLQKNLTLLQKSNAKLAYQIRFIDPDPLKFCYTAHNQLNLQRTYQGVTYYYHSTTDVFQEAQSWFESMPSTSIIFVYGIGLGYFYEAAKIWLKSDAQHALVFLEEDLAVLHRLLETAIGTEIVKNPQVQIVTLGTLSENKELLSELAWTYIFCPFEVACLPLYQKANPIQWAELAHLIKHEMVQKNAFAQEYLLFGIPFLRNFYPNLLKLDQAYLGNGLFNRFKDIPAIICGAGPSLDKNVSFLKTLRQKALIFAGSSALPALIANDVIPHFGAAIDPNQAQYGRIQTAHAHSIPFFYRNRLFHEALLAIVGPRLYLTGSGGYEVADWFDAALGIEGDVLDEGHNIVNFCIEIAAALGCNPIILVGVDLALTDQKHYAQGVIQELHLQEADLKLAEDFDSQPIVRKDIDGRPIYTLWKWVTEANWIDQFAQDHPLLTFINCTEGGLGFSHIPNFSLKEAARDHLQSKRDFDQDIKKEIKTHCTNHVTQDAIKDCLLNFQQSLTHCLTHLDALLTEMEQVILKKENLSSLETPLMTLKEAELEAEIGYQFLLDTFNILYLKCHQRAIQALQRPKRHSSEKSQNKKKAQLHMDRLHFLKDVAQASIELINWSLKNDI